MQIGLNDIRLIKSNDLTNERMKVCVCVCVCERPQYLQLQEIKRYFQAQLFVAIYYKIFYYYKNYWSKFLFLPLYPFHVDAGTVRQYSNWFHLISCFISTACIKTSLTLPQTLNLKLENNSVKNNKIKYGRCVLYDHTCR